MITSPTTCCSPMQTNNWVSRQASLRSIRPPCGWWANPKSLLSLSRWSRSLSSNPLPERSRKCFMDHLWKYTAWRKCLVQTWKSGIFLRNGSISGLNYARQSSTSEFMTLSTTVQRGVSLSCKTSPPMEVYRTSSPRLEPCLRRSWSTWQLKFLKLSTICMKTR